MNKRYSEGIGLFRKKAIEEKGGSFQEDLLNSAMVLEGADFVKWLDKKIASCKSSTMDVVEGDDDISLPSVEKITASTFINPPLDVMVEWYGLWRDIPMRDASSYGFWGYVTRRMIEEGRILPRYLVLKSGMEGGNGEDAGKEQIIKAIENGPIEMDKCVRNFCRHLSGLFEERGARSLYVDCCLARAWWKCHISELAGGEDWKQSILPVVREGGLWANLGEKMATKLTVLGDINIRGGIVQFLSSDEGEGYRKKEQLIPLLLRIGVKTSWCAMGIFTPEEVCTQITEIAKET